MILALLLKLWALNIARKARHLRELCLVVQTKSGSAPSFQNTGPDPTKYTYTDPQPPAPNTVFKAFFIFVASNLSVPSSKAAFSCPNNKIDIPTLDEKKNIGNEIAQITVRSQYF